MPSEQPVGFRNNEAKQQQSSTYCYCVHVSPETGTGHRNLWTRFDQPVTIEDCPSSLGGGTKTFQPVQINHGRIELTAEYKQQATAVSIIASDELRLFFQTASSNKVLIRVFKVNTASLINGDPISFTTHVFESISGLLKEVTITGNLLTGTIVPEPYFLDRAIPRYSFQRQCNHKLYDENTCGAVKGNFRLDSVIKGWTRSTRTLRVEGQLDGDEPLSFAGGYLRHVSSDLIFGILKESKEFGDTFLRLNSWNGVLENMNDDVDVFRGCRHTLEDCEAFGRKAHFGGFPYIPNKNPTVHGV